MPPMGHKLMTLISSHMLYYLSHPGTPKIFLKSLTHTQTFPQKGLVLVIPGHFYKIQ